MKVLVIGATGFIGGAIARAAVAQGWQVRAMRRDDRRVGAIGDLAQQGYLEWHQANLMDPSALAEAMRGCSLVFHAAGYYPTSSREPDRQVRRAQSQMEQVLLAFRQARPDLLLYTSSLSTIGRPAQPDRLADERDVYQRGSVSGAYFDAKIVMEQSALQSGLPVVVLCPTAVLGPGDVKPTTGRLLIYVVRGQVPCYPDGQINVVDVRDVAATHIGAVERGRRGERYVVGGDNLSFGQMLAEMARQAGRRPPWIRAPARLVEWAGLLGGRAGIPGADHLRAIRHFQPLNDSKARAELGHTSRPFAQTVHDTLVWFREHGYLDGRDRVST